MNTPFPHIQNRLQYLVRLLIFSGVLSGIAYALGLFVRVPRTTPIWIPFLIIGVLFVLRFVYLDIPRFRSMRWSPWLVVLFFIPVANLVIQILLLVVPPKVQPNTALEPTPTAP